MNILVSWTTDSHQNQVEEVEGASQPQMTHKHGGVGPLQNLRTGGLGDKQTFRRGHRVNRRWQGLPYPVLHRPDGHSDNAGRWENLFRIPAAQVCWELVRHCVWFAILGPGPASKGEREPTQEESPPCLPCIEPLGPTEVGQVLVIHPQQAPPSS